MTGHVRWERRPTLAEPVLLAAFEGWNDAGDAASSALEHLAMVARAARIATIDPETFYDFTATRPEVRMLDGRTRSIEWPEPTLRAGTLPGADGDDGLDVVLLAAHEPGLRWRTFCEQVLGVAGDLGVTRVITLGALLAEVPHTRAPRIIGTADDDELIGRLGLRRSTYEGPTGIVGVLADAATAAGFPSVSLWAAVPTYVPGAPCPPATVALLERASEVLGHPIPAEVPATEAREYITRIDEIVADDEDLVRFVERLEQAQDESEVTEPDPDRLIAEVERYLRDN